MVQLQAALAGLGGSVVALYSATTCLLHFMEVCYSCTDSAIRGNILGAIAQPLALHLIGSWPQAAVLRYSCFPGKPRCRVTAWANDQQHTANLS